MSQESFTVYVVDDDESIRRALKRLLRSFGYHALTFESAEDFLDSASGQKTYNHGRPGLTNKQHNVEFGPLKTPKYRTFGPTALHSHLLYITTIFWVPSNGPGTVL